MAHSEACELFIEQQIKESLEEGKTPYSIGKDLAVWLEKLFEAKIPPKTLEKRAQRIEEKLKTNVFNNATAQDDSENHEKQTNQTVTEQSPSNKHVPGPGRGLKYHHGKNAGDLVSPLPKEEHEMIAVGGVAEVKLASSQKSPGKTRKPINEPEPIKRTSSAASHAINCATEAMEFAVMAISQLERIRKDDPRRIEALERVELWIGQRKKEN